MTKSPAQKSNVKLRKFHVFDQSTGEVSDGIVFYHNLCFQEACLR